MVPRYRIGGGRGGTPRWEILPQGRIFVPLGWVGVAQNGLVM